MSDDFVLINVMVSTEVAQDPTPDRVAGYLGIAVADLQDSYGVVPVGATGRLFSVMVAKDKFDRMSDEAKRNIEGPFANPKIAPFGPVK
jgi:hypothetical protein